VDEPINLLEEIAGDLMGKGVEISPFSLESIHGPFSEGSMDAHIGGIVPPDVSSSIQIFHILELSAFQEVMFDVVKGTFHLAVAFFSAGRENDDPKAVLISEWLKSRVDPDFPGADMPAHRGHVVIGHGNRNSPQFLEGHFVEFDDAFKGLIYKMPMIQPSAETQNNGPGLNHSPPSPYDHLMGAPVHLAFFSWRMINGGPGRSIGSWADCPDIFLENGILAAIADFLDLFHDPYSGKALFTDEESDLGLIGV
jgi:hypothetical protein